MLSVLDTYNCGAVFQNLGNADIPLVFSKRTVKRSCVGLDMLTTATFLRTLPQQ